MRKKEKEKKKNDAERHLRNRFISRTLLPSTTLYAEVIRKKKGIKTYCRGLLFAEEEVMEYPHLRSAAIEKWVGSGS